MSSKSLAIVGGSGTGKTTALRNLRPKETVIIQLLPKALTWPGWKKDFSSENKNFLQYQKWDEVTSAIVGISKSMPHIKQIVVDDVGYTIIRELFSRSDEKNFNNSIHHNNIHQLCLCYK